MNKKLYYLPLLLLFLLLAMTLPVAAFSGLESVTAIAGLAQPESVGISPPGWLGGALALLALILPIVAWLWMRRKSEL